MSARYSKDFKLQVAKEAASPEFKGLEHVIAEKYGIMQGTVERWRDIYIAFGEDGLKRKRPQKKKSPREMELEKENAELKEEIEILKKAAAFLANAKHE